MEKYFCRVVRNCNLNFFFGKHYFSSITQCTVHPEGEKPGKNPPKFNFSKTEVSWRLLYCSVMTVPFSTGFREKMSFWVFWGSYWAVLGPRRFKVPQIWSKSGQKTYKKSQKSHFAVKCTNYRCRPTQTTAKTDAIIQNCPVPSSADPWQGLKSGYFGSISAHFEHFSISWKFVLSKKELYDRVHTV